MVSPTSFVVVRKKRVKGYDLMRYQVRALTFPLYLSLFCLIFKLPCLASHNLQFNEMLGSPETQS